MMIEKTDYQELQLLINALCDGVPYALSNLANAAALLWERMDGINWAGFYLRRGDRLILGPFQGKVACTEILIGRGVCGHAAERKQAVVVPDVHAFPDHIACDAASRSEIVLPLLHQGEVLGVLDIDSPHLARFDENDRKGLEAFAEILVAALSRDADFCEGGSL